VRIDPVWNFEVLQVVGPIIGHASDGDSRRRQLMLKDYLYVSCKRFSVPWIGWLLFASG
jgi:hypothetical protein